MSKEKQLLKNTIIVSIGKMCTQLITFFLLPLYTTVLSTTEYGLVDLLNTLISLLLPIVTFQLEQGIFRYLIDYRNNYNKQKEVISTSFFMIFGFAIIFTLFFIIISPVINGNYKYFLFLSLISQIASTVLLQISRGIGNNFKYSFGSLLIGSVTVILNVVLIVWFKLGVYGMLLGTFLGNIIGSLYLFFSLKVYKLLNINLFDKNISKNLLKYSIPLIPNSISWWIVNVSDRSIISFYMGVDANGIYSAANKFSGVITTLYQIFNLTWTESASIYINSNDADHYFSSIFDLVFRLFGSICLCVIAYMPFIFNIMINNNFSDAYFQIPLLMVAAFFNILVSFIGSIYIAKKLTNEIAKTSIYAGLINIVVNFLLIRYIGLFAASLSTIIAYLTMFIFRFIDSKKYINIKINKKIIVYFSIFYMLVFISYYSNLKILNYIMAFGVTIFSLLLNKQNITTFIFLIFNKFFKKFN